MKKHIFSLLALLICSLIAAFVLTRDDGKLHIVFCDVGQGDAIYIRSAGGADMLVDGGPNDKVLLCLGEHMPFTDHSLDLVVLTHPEKDHFQGLTSVLARFQVGAVILSPVVNPTESYQLLLDVLKEKALPVKNLYAGDIFHLGEAQFSVLWPDRGWVSQVVDSDHTEVTLSRRDVLGASTKNNLNDFSLYLHLQYDAFDLLLTGDGDRRIQPSIMRTNALPDVDMLKFPHHGSKTGLLAEFLDSIAPELVIFSAGKNPWGHPTEQALRLVQEKNISIKRTDRDGSIHIVTDGNSWEFARPVW